MSHVTRLLACALVVVALGLLTTALAQEKEGPNHLSADKAKEVKSSQSVEMAQNLALAHSMVHFGRNNKSPEVLIAAAKILSTIPTQDHKNPPKVTLKEGKQPMQPKDEMNPFNLIKEAKELAKGNKVVLAAADKMADECSSAPRGAVKGPFKSIHNIPAFGTHNWSESFYANQWAVVTLDGDGGTDLDIYVYDQNGNLIVSDVGLSDYATVRWVPKWTGPFTIRITNLGARNNVYYLINN